MEKIPTDGDRYVYAAKVVRCVDGDTVVLDIDLGCNVVQHGEHCRLLGIDSPEKRGKSKEAGLAAKCHLERLLDTDKRIIIRTHKDKRGSFNRLLVELWRNGVDVNRQMVADGHAIIMER